MSQIFQDLLLGTAVHTPYSAVTEQADRMQSLALHLEVNQNDPKELAPDGTRYLLMMVIKQLSRSAESLRNYADCLYRATCIPIPDTATTESAAEACLTEVDTHDARKAVAWLATCIERTRFDAAACAKASTALRASLPDRLKPQDAPALASTLRRLATDLKALCMLGADWHQQRPFAAVLMLEAAGSLYD